jgi:hypothetical protein
MQGEDERNVPVKWFTVVAASSIFPVFGRALTAAHAGTVPGIR